jgi:RimJ/RimL family protein N-acetyltransferase
MQTTPHAAMREVVIETPRLRLREFGIDDAAFIVELLNDPLWRRFIGDRNVRTREEAARYLENGPMRAYAERGFGLWLVESRPDAVSIGMCGLVKRDELPDVDLGFAFLEAHRGQGHALEAAGATLRHAHDALGFARIAAITHPANRRSARLLEKLGFVRDGTLEPSATRKDPARLWVHVDRGRKT